MPRRPLRPCPEPGCSVLVQAGRCAAHRAVPDRRRGSSTERGYGRRSAGGNWRAIAEHHKAAEPLCRYCRAGLVLALVAGEWEVVSSFAPRLTPAVAVDHIVPLDDGGVHDWPSDDATAALLVGQLRVVERVISTAERQPVELERCNRQSLCASCHGAKSGAERPRQEERTPIPLQISGPTGRATALTSKFVAAASGVSGRES